MQIEYIQYPHDSTWDMWLSLAMRHSTGGVHMRSVWLVPGTYDDDGKPLQWAAAAYYGLV